MSLDLNDEILQDFLVEAGEILENLNEELVDLEQRPDDLDLLNSVFRGFHTIKGGAGFLGIDELVAVCHRAEDVFNVLRQGDRAVDAELMDAVLQVLDTVNGMFEAINGGKELESADPELLDKLRLFALPVDKDTVAASNESAVSETIEESSPPAEESPPEPQAADNKAVTGQPGQQSGSDEITEEEFENLLDQLHGEGKHSGVPSTGQAAADKASEAPDTVTSEQGSSDEIDEDEFEALLDQLHGKGKHGGVPAQDATPETSAEADEKPAPAGNDEIDEDEFEALLDQLHGKGKHGGVPAQDATPETSGEADKKPASASSDEIDEDEFEALLDQLHGKGKHGGVPVGEAQSAAPKAPAEKVDAESTAPAAQEAGAKSPPSTPPKPAAEEAAVAPKKVAAVKQAVKKPPAGETTVRVDTSRLDDIMNMVGELVLVRNRLATLRAELGEGPVANAVGNLDVVTSDLQLAVMKTRMQPVKKVFGRFPRVVRDLARSLKKEIDLEMHGEDTDLDKNLVEALADPLVHLVRNAVDHGIELPEERVQVGKDRKGKVVLSASQEGDHILLSIADDGKGMDADVLRNKAVEKGLMDHEAASRLDNKECYNLIFQPGFSTKAEISDISGRGVGMDVVKTRIAQMNGTVEIDSEKGKGSIIIVKLPLTLAILPTLMVVLGTQPFALPLSNVVEIFNMDDTRTNVVDGQLTIRVRDRALPLFNLHNWLVNDANAPKAEDGGHVVVVNVGGVHLGLLVDYLVGQEEVVIKPLGALLQGLEGMAGATITGDGKIALILDIPGLMRKYARRF